MNSVNSFAKDGSLDEGMNQVNGLQAFYET